MYTRKKGVEYNKKGFPYVPAKVKETNWRVVIEYYVWSIPDEKLLRRRRTSFEGNTFEEQKKSAKTLVYRLNKLLYEGHMIKNPDDSTEKTRYSVLDALVVAANSKLIQLSNPESSKSYKYITRVFGAFLSEKKVSGMEIGNLSKPHFLQFRDWLIEKRGVKNSTVNSYITRISTLLDTLVEREIIKENPAKDISKLPSSVGKNIPFTDAERERFEAYLLENCIELFQFTRFIYYGFLRPSEILNLRVKDIDLKNRIIIIRSTRSKNKRQLPVVITSQLQKVIERMEIGACPEDYFLFSRKLRPGPHKYSRGSVSKRHIKALKELNMFNGELTLYSWKHTGNCNAYRAGVDIRSIQQQNRHHSLEMTEIYLRSMGLRVSPELRNLEW